MELPEKFPAMCPECGGKGCEKCKDGQVEVSFKKGDLFTCACLLCGFENGGYITETYPSESSEPCVMCGGETEWKFLCEMK